MKLMKEDRIHLLKDQNELVYQQHILQAAEYLDNEVTADNEKDDIQEKRQHQPIISVQDEDKVFIDLNGSEYVPSTDDLSKTVKTKLEMKDFDLQMLEREVLSHMRRNSKIITEGTEDSANQ